MPRAPLPRYGLALLVLVSLWAVDGAARAQPFIHGGGGTIDASALNDALNARDLPSVPAAYLSYGAGGHGRIGRLIVGGAGHALRGFTRAEGGASASLNDGAYGFFDIGYVMARGDRWRLYPLVSVGGGTVQIEVAQNVGPGFEDAIDDPGRRTRFETGGFLVGLSLAGEVNIPDWLAVLGVRVGYYAAPASGSLRSDGIELQNAPDLSMRGPYVRISFGGGVGALIVGELIGSLFS